MTISEHSSVMLKRPLPALCLEPGDVGVVLHSYRNGEAFEVEFLGQDGTTLGLATVVADDLLDTSQMNLRFRFHFWLVRSWPFRAVAWVRSKHVPESKDFGKFGDLRRNTEDARMLQELLDTAADLSTYGVMSKTDMARVQKLCDEAETAHLNSLRAEGPGPWDTFFRDGPRTSDDFMPDPLFDPKNDHLFLAKAAHTAFEHLKARRDEHGLVRRTPEQLEADRIALARFAVKFARHPISDPAAEELFRDLPPAEAFERLEQLQEREDRRLNKILWWSGSLGLLCVAILAVLLLSK